MATPTPVFPAAVATDSDLKVANNLIQTTLRVSVDNANTILFVASTDGFAANMLVSIDKEIIAIAAVASAPNQALLVASGGRGFDGTTAAAHSAGAKVSIFIDAWHHNALSSEIQAIENALGPNLINVSTDTQLISSKYNFAPQQPGGALTAGTANVVTLSPVPEGVNGTNTAHQLYISGGTGGAEVVTIAGGTAVSGAPSGTIIFTPANNHSGAWTIQTATAGIQEALWKGGVGATVVVPATAAGQLVYGTVTFPYIDQTVKGTGPGSLINKLSTTNNLLVIPQGVYNIEISNLMLTGTGSLGSHTGGTMIYADRCALAHIFNIRIYNCYNGIDVVGTATTTSNAGITEMQAIFIQEAAGTGLSFSHGWYSDINIANSIAGAFGVQHNVGDGTVMTNLVIGGPFSRMLYIAPTGPAYVMNLMIANLQIDSWKQYGIVIGGAVVGGVRGINIANIHLGTQGSDAANNVAILIAASPNHVHFNGGKIFLMQKQAVIIESGALDVAFSNIEFLATAQAGGVPTIECHDTIARFALIGNTFGTFPAIDPTPHATYCVSMTGAASSILTFIGNQFLAFATAPLFFAATPGVGTVIRDNSWIDDQMPNVASAATVVFPVNPEFFLTGNVAVTAVSGLWEGAHGKFIATSATPGAWTAGATIANSLTPVTNVAVVWSFHSGKIWLK